MSSLRTKVLIWCAGLSLMLVTPLVLPKVIPYLFSKFSTNSTIVSVQIHTVPFIACVVIWVVVVVCARISFLHDKRRVSGQ